MERILIVEDEPAILAGVKDNLELEGYEVLTAENGREGLVLAESKKPDLIVLDVMLPDVSGFEVCRTLREKGDSTFVVMLTAKKDEVDIVRGLTLGADDYITKPFRLMEFLARIKAILRRGAGEEAAVDGLSFGDVKVDFKRFEAAKGGEALPLTAREFKILGYFASHPGKVITRNELLDKVWGYKMFPSTRTVDNHIMRLRKQIEDDPSDPKFIVSVRGVGYKFNA
ncbi:MAG: response regulator transcription factor, partial [Planctomycetota bacterium]|jgi:DNA-binding response OmpR family regulator